MYQPDIGIDIPEITRLTSAGFGRRSGLGRYPAVVCIDIQNYMTGREGHDEEYPSSCGKTGRDAVRIITRILEIARSINFPVIYTRFVFRNAEDMGVYGLKREFRDSPNWCVEGTHGAEIADEVKPLMGDFIIDKRRPSAFFATKLNDFLISNGVDSLIVVGGATSNCVRATVYDACSLDYRTTVVSDAVFDRVRISHEMSLFDMDRQFADVLSSRELEEHIRRQFHV